MSAVPSPRPPRSWSPVIDTHAHVFTADLPRVAGATFLPSESFPTERYLACLDANGIGYGVLAAPSFLGTNSDYAIAAMRGELRLRATAIVPPDIGFERLRGMARQGVAGIRFSLRHYPSIPDLTSDDYRGLLRRVRDLGMHVHLFAEPERLEMLVPQLQEAGVTLILDHFGNPSDRAGLVSDTLKRAVQAGRTWVRLSAPFRLSVPSPREAARALLEACGAERLLWGSDCPWVGYEGRFTFRDTIDWFEDFVPDALARERIGRNGLEMYGFAPAAAA